MLHLTPCRLSGVCGLISNEPKQCDQANGCLPVQPLPSYLSLEMVFPSAVEWDWCLNQQHTVLSFWQPELSRNTPRWEPTHGSGSEGTIHTFCSIMLWQKVCLCPLKSQAHGCDPVLFPSSTSHTRWEMFFNFMKCHTQASFDRWWHWTKQNGCPDLLIQQFNT